MWTFGKRAERYLGSTILTVQKFIFVLPPRGVEVYKWERGVSYAASRSGAAAIVETVSGPGRVNALVRETTLQSSSGLRLTPEVEHSRWKFINPREYPSAFAARCCTPISDPPLRAAAESNAKIDRVRLRLVDFLKICRTKLLWKFQSSDRVSL